jgi:hypothetical protein
LLALLHAGGHAPLIGGIRSLVMPAQQETTSHACSTSDGRTQAGIARECANNCATRGTSRAARERALLGFAQTGAAADDHKARDKSR